MRIDRCPSCDAEVATAGPGEHPATDPELRACLDAESALHEAVHGRRLAAFASLPSKPYPVAHQQELLRDGLELLRCGGIDERAAGARSILAAQHAEWQIGRIDAGADELDLSLAGFIRDSPLELMFAADVARALRRRFG